jgi:hypothetical protein
MNPKFYPVFNLFLDFVLNGREMTFDESVLTICRRYEIEGNDARDLILQAMMTRWFSFAINSKSIVWKSAGFRTRVRVDHFRRAYEAFDDGGWRSADTLSRETRVAPDMTQDICVIYEAVGILDSRKIWPNEVVYAKIIGAEPVLYAKTFDIM